jgi:hypothetical protein
MIDCETTKITLENIKNKKDTTISSSDYSDLKKFGLLVKLKSTTVDGPADSNLGTLRMELSKINRTKSEIRKKMMDLEKIYKKQTPRKIFSRYREYKKLRLDLSKQEEFEKRLRTKFLNQLQAVNEKLNYAKVNTEAVVLTYKGREMLETLSQRMERVKVSKLQEFDNELKKIRSVLTNISVNGGKILKKISPKYKNIDEIHLRFSSVGLACKMADIDQTVEQYMRAVDEITKAMILTRPVSLTLAEAITVLSEEPGEFNEYLKKVKQLLADPWNGRIISDDQLRAAAIILSNKKDVTYLSRLGRLISSNYCPNSFSAGAFLGCLLTKEDSLNISELVNNEDLLLENEVIKRFRSFKDHLYSISHSQEDSNTSAALLCSSGLPDEAVLDRFQTAHGLLKKFNGNSVLMLSAMLAIMPYDISEALDNVRLAAAAIRAKKLSIGGMENLSLGVKLFLNTTVRNLIPVASSSGALSIVATSSKVQPATISASAATISITTAATLGAGLLTFHELSLHKMAVSDFKFHPVHVHYVYG